MLTEKHRPVLIVIADRVYIYDNSIDDTEARLLFRMTDGKLFKCYTDDIPLWAQTIIDLRITETRRIIKN